MATFLALPATAALAAGGCFVPLVNFPFILIALAPMLGSLPMISLAIVDGERLQLWAPFLGFTRYERFVGLYWVPYLIAAGASIPLVAALWVDRHISSDSARPLLFGLAGALTLTIFCAVLHRYILAPCVAAERDSPAAFPAVLERAVSLIESRRAAVYARLLGLALFAAAGALAAGFGVLLTFPLAAVAWAHLYRALAETAGLE